MTEYAHLHPDFRHVMALSDQEQPLSINQDGLDIRQPTRSWQP